MTNESTLWFSRAGLAQVDRRAVEEFGIPIMVLMENAGRAVAQVTRAYTNPESQVLIIAGPGNNGGDGLAAARHLANLGHQVQILLTGEAKKYSGAAAQQLGIVQKMALPILASSDPIAAFNQWLESSNVDDAIVDGIFGTGLSRPVSGSIAGLIDAINDSQRRVLSIDIPSGLDCDTGQPLGTAVRAVHTVSFCGMKIGFHNAEAIAYLGQISIGDIGAPQKLLQECSQSSPE
jgi:hydroxyethylthiazole kinase-like uncharacterized protein yjeF